MGSEQFVFVDIETDGGSAERGRAIEVAAIKVVDGKIIDTFRSLINPGSDIPYRITKLTGISTADVANAPYFADIASQLHDFMIGSIFVAHNVLFDYSFLKHEFARCDMPFTPKLFCTVKMSRALYPEHKGHSLEKIIARHAIPVSSRHRAYDDALAMYSFVVLAVNQKGADAFANNLALQLKTQSLPPHVDEQSILSLPETPGIYIFEDDQGAPLYVGKSVNIRARVRSHFTNATRVAKEMNMTLRSHNITYTETETEVEALLLESAKVKELRPLLNRKLRRSISQCLVIKQTDDAGYAIFTAENHDIANYANLENVYGVFTSKRSAKSSLESIARTYQLCPKLMGLETAKNACFRTQLGLCRGACLGKESAELYNQRVELALDRLKIETWPYESKVSVAISSFRSLVIDQWIPQGIYDQQTGDYIELPRAFDMDVYKIIRSYIRTHNPSIRLL